MLFAITTIRLGRQTLNPRYIIITIIVAIITVVVLAITLLI